MNVRLALSAVLTIAASAAPPLLADPPANFPLPGYRDFTQITRRVLDLAKPNLAQVRSFGKTGGGLDVWLLTIGHGDVDHKPAVLVVGNAHAPLLVGEELALRIAADLERDDAATRALLDRVTFYIIPCPDPDATAAMFNTPTTQRTTDARPTDDDHDGRVDEDRPDDLNGDGLVTMMRVEDPGGEWMPSPADPRVMIRADAAKGEHGRYRLYSEGLDDDHDGLYNEDGPGGVAFDRNFPFRYPYFAADAGPFQLSEPQTLAVARFVVERANIAAVFSFGMEDNLDHPWKPDGASEQKQIKNAVLAADAPWLDHLAGEYQKLHAEKGAPSTAPGAGSFAEWCYFDMGRWSVATRGWWPPEIKSDKQAGGERGAEELNALRWMDREHVDGFVPWSVVKDADFPGQRVEVGGFKPLVRLNPPAKELDGLGVEHAKFVRELAEDLPRVSIERVKVEPLGAGVFRVTATVRNSGYLPTTSAMGKIAEEPRPLQIAAVLPKGATLIRGPLRQRLDPIRGGGGTAEATWLLRSGPGELTVKIWSPAIGEDTKSVTLGSKAN